jgi:hypothetical protein
MQNTYRSNEEDTSTILRYRAKSRRSLEKESRTEVKGVPR